MWHSATSCVLGYTLLWHPFAALQATGGSRLPLLRVGASTFVPFSYLSMRRYYIHFILIAFPKHVSPNVPLKRWHWWHWFFNSSAKVTFSMPNCYISQTTCAVLPSKSAQSAQARHHPSVQLRCEITYSWCNHQIFRGSWHSWHRYWVPRTPPFSLKSHHYSE